MVNKIKGGTNMIIKSMINKYNCLTEDELRFARQFLKEKGVTVSTRCNTCRGAGYWWVLSSDEDADIEQCQDCDIIAVQLGADFARFLQRGWRDLKKSIKGGNENV